MFRKLVKEITSGPVKGEGGVRVVLVTNSNVVDCLGVVELLHVRIVGQPGRVPVVDAVEIRGVIRTLVIWKNRRKSQSGPSVV